MKYVLVTGAYGGMGRATVKELVKKGFTVFALDKKIGSAENGVIPVQTDVSDFESVKSAFEKVKAVTNELCAVIHFAGVYSLNSFVEISNEEFDRVFKINLYGVFFVNKVFVSLLKKQGNIIITTSELAPLNPLPFTGIYAVSKSALDGYAFSLRMELQLKDISVSVIRAGAVSTDMLGCSVSALNDFCKTTKTYTCNAERFKKIVDKIEAKNVNPNKIADKVLKILRAKTPKFVYKINRNKLLLLFNVLPKGVQFKIIKRILK